MKHLFLFLLLSNTLINANFDNLYNLEILDFNQQIIESIKSNNYDSVKELLSNRLISASSIYLNLIAYYVVIYSTVFRH